MSQPSIMGALTSVNYTLCKMRCACLFERRNVSGWLSHVIFSMLLARGLNISLPHLQLFLTRAAYNIECRVCAWMKQLTLFLFSKHCSWTALLHDTAQTEVMQHYIKQASFFTVSYFKLSQICYQDSKTDR